MIRSWGFRLASLPLLLDQSFRSTDVRDQVCWLHGGLVWEGEGLGPKRVEGRVMERVNPFMDKAGDCVPGVFLRVLYRAADVELKKLFKTYWLCSH